MEVTKTGSCNCKYNDGWRCAVDRVLSTVTCPCPCHQTPISHYPQETTMHPEENSNAEGVFYANLAAPVIQSEAPFAQKLSETVAPEMDWELKFKRLREAILNLLELQSDDRGELIGFLDSLIREKPESAEERKTRDDSLYLIVALLETHADRMPQKVVNTLRALGGV